MRKITKESINAFLSGKPYKSGNTEVVINEFSTGGTVTQLYLFNNLIAEDSNTGFKITNAGWQSNTTKERLNGFPTVRIHQVKGIWCLNGKEWSGEWTEITSI